MEGLKIWKKNSEAINEFIRNLPSNLMDDMKKRWEATVEETKHHIGEDYETGTKHFSNILVINLLLALTSIFDKSSRFKLENSLLIIRIAALMDHIPWIWSNVQYGAYHQAIRELRYVFESMLQAFYIDEGHPDSTLACKVELVKEIEKTKYRLYGQPLIDELDVSDKQSLKVLYRDLSKYVHCSLDELRGYLDLDTLNRHLMFGFQKELFNLCKVLTNQTLDVAYYLLCNQYPDITERLKKDKALKKYLKSLQCELTLNLLKR